MVRSKRLSDDLIKIAQIFANELHEPVALVVIECVVERLRCIGDLAQVRGVIAPVSIPMRASSPHASGPKR